MNRIFPFLIIFSVAVVILPKITYATAYTSNTVNCATTCNWNNGASWTGGTGSDYPDDAGDTVIISAGDYVVIPVGVSITTGAITFNNGSGAGNESTIDILGTLDLAGAVSMVNYAMLKGGPDGTLDLNGQTITVSGSVSRYTFTGTSGHPFNIISTGSRGAMITSGLIQLVSTWDYVNISGLADSTFGRSHNVAYTQHYEHSVFSDMENFAIDGVSTNINAGFEFNFNDIRNPHTPTGTDYQPTLTMANQSLGTAPREMTFNTWDGGSLLGKIVCINCTGTVTFNDNVLKDFQIASVGSAYITPQRNMFYNSLGSDQAFFINTDGMFSQAVTDHYFYYDGDNHPLGYISASVNVQDSIFENTGLGSDWFLFNAYSQVATVQNNIFLGKGSPLTFTGVSAPTLNIVNNTMYGSNDNTAFSWGVLTEQVAELTGTVNYYNNLLVDSNTTAGGEAATYVRTDTANQIDVANYNGHAGYTNLGVYTPTLFSYLDNAGASTISPAAGVNDIQADPLFVDRTRKLSTWDTSLGGAGTEANAIAEMLKLNGTGGTYDTDYNVSNLLTYVQAGFTPQASAYNGTGSGGVDIGAISFNITHTLNYTAGANGSIAGSTPQTVNDGADGTEVVADPDVGYHFTTWSDAVLTAARTDTNVTGDINVTASFAIDTKTLTYSAGANGLITGDDSQTINYGADGTEVVATPNSGYQFTTWSDGLLTATRTDTNVISDVAVTATFEVVPESSSSSGSHPKNKSIPVLTYIPPTLCPFGHLFSTTTGLPCTTFFTPSSTTSPACVINATLKQGSKGEQVKCLQTGLNILSDGIFGPMTKASVISFQKLHNLVPDGIFGPLSLGQWGR
jgi:hypothetical protein